MKRFTGCLGVILIFAFGVFVGVMAARADSDEQTWTRLAWLFSSVEAIAFGAAGLLFGSSIQRARAERAEGEADSARPEVQRHATDAANGRALAAALEADAPPDGPATTGRRRGV